MIAKCQCQRCGGSVEFEAEEIEVSGETSHRKLGQIVECPNCNQPTQLYLNKAEFLVQKNPSDFADNKAEEKQNAIRDAEGRAIIRVFRLFFSFALIAGISWWIFFKSSQPERQTFPVNDVSAAVSPPKVSVSNLNGEIQSYGGMDATGIIHNLSGVTLNGVSVNFSFFDDDGNKVDDAMDFIQTLAPDDPWKFKVSSLKTNCKKYRLDKITSYIGNSEVNLDVVQTQ